MQRFNNTEATWERLTDLEQCGLSPYPHRFDRTHLAAELARDYADLPAGTGADTAARIAGRVMAIRRHQIGTFVDIDDRSGRMQAFLPCPSSSQPTLAVVDVVNQGDIIGVAGEIFRSRTGELTVRGDEARLLAPNTRLMPDKLRGVRDRGLTRAQRHLSLLGSPTERRRFLQRSELVRSTRQFLWEHDFVEVETAVLDTVYGGAEARPFTTFCEALGEQLFLRISPELALKRLLVGGMERVFEIGKQFRNEGLDARHHPEFTSIELYQAYADYHDMMELTECLISTLACRLVGSPTVCSRLQDTPARIDLTPPFRRITLLDAIKQYTGVDFSDADDDRAHSLANRLNVPVNQQATADEVVISVFETRVEEHLLQPTFVLDYPASLCPLTKQHRDDPRFAERFELYIHGMEFANAYSELNDPREQARHFLDQARRRQEGDDLAHLPDWEFVEALSYGMPPAGGLGIGIDRLVLLLTGTHHIQDVILFPLQRQAVTGPFATESIDKE